MNPAKIKLSPSQQKNFDGALALIPAVNVIVLNVAVGCGRTLMLRELHAKLGGKLLSMGDFINALCKSHPLAIEEAIWRVIKEALDDSDVLLTDDFDASLLQIGSYGADAVAMLTQPDRQVFVSKLKSICVQTVAGH